VLLPDTGRNYLTKIFSDKWMQKNGFWEGKEIKTIRVKEILSQKKDFLSIISISPKNTLIDAIKLIHKYSISQIPVILNNKVVGSLNEASIMKLLHDDLDLRKQEISSVMGKPIPTLDENVDASEAYRLLLSGATGIVVTKEEIPIGIITRTDLINDLITQKEKRNYEI